MKKIIIYILMAISVVAYSNGASEMIATFNKNDANKYGAIVDKYSKETGVPPEVIVTIMARETQGKNLGPSLSALSSEKQKNRDLQPMGVMQLSKTSFIEGLMATGMSKKDAEKYSSANYRMTPELNIRAGVGYVKKQLQRCKGDMGCAIGSYNSGYGGFKAFLKGNGSNARKDEASHYLVDTNYKLKILKKAKEKGFDSLTEKERKLLQNGINTKKEKGNWRTALKELSNGKGDYNLDNVVSELEETSSKVIYISEVKFDWDEIASTVANETYDALKLLKSTGLILISILFAIQLLLDGSQALANWNPKAYFTTFFKRCLTFATYTFIISKILDGTLLKVFEEMSYGFLRLLTKENGVQKLSNIWNVKEQITSKLWEAISQLWGWSSIIPTELAEDLVASIIILVLIAILSIAFFIMMANLFKALLFFQIALGMSTLLLPLGILDASKEYYNIGKVLSMGLNFMIKLVSINFIAFIIMKILTDNNSVLNLNASNITTLMATDFIAFIILVMVMSHLISKVEVQF